MNEDRSIAVVGGSAAGFYTACLLARAGRSVTLFERQERLEPLARTLIVTSKFRDLLGAAADSSVVNEIRRFELFADGRIETVPLKRPDLIIERAELIRTAARYAVEAGVEVRYGHELIGLEPRRQGVRLLLRPTASPASMQTVETFDADVVIGADGAFSAVAEAAGWGRQPTLPLMQAIVELPAGIRPDSSLVWFVPDDTPYFFWLIPDSPEVGALGIIGEDGQRTRAALERFVQDKGFEVLDHQGARIPLYKGWVPVHRRYGGGDVYLVGDAAGQVKVTTVGGIVTGLRGGLGVAEAILDHGYSPTLDALRMEMDFHLWIRRSMHGFSEDDYRRLLDYIGGSALAPLGLITRDETPRLLWNVFRERPAIVWFGLRHLLLDGGFPPRHFRSPGYAES